MRPPNQDEDFIDTDGSIKHYPSLTYNGSQYPRVIVKKKFIWPTWLKAAYIAMDKNGEWYAFKEKPEQYYDNSWSTRTDKICMLNDIVDIDLPECSDWTQSLIKNPNRNDI